MYKQKRKNRLCLKAYINGNSMNPTILIQKSVIIKNKLIQIKIRKAFNQ